MAIAGNPNAGKTTVFNALTGANAKISNYPGTTIDRRTAEMVLPKAGKVELVDVPGTYSLTARSEDEEVAINELIGRRGLRQPDLVVVVLDATTLERNLYLLMQVMEFDIPVIAVVNMMDQARKEGLVIDLTRLSATFKIPFIGAVARKYEGIEELKSRLDQTLAGEIEGEKPGWMWQPCPELESDFKAFEELLEAEVGFLGTPNRRRAFVLWLLMSLHPENDVRVRPRIRKKALEVQRTIEAAGRDLDEETTVQRYRFIDAHAGAFIARSSSGRRQMTERIDGILTHPIWGALTFIFIMGLVFQALFSWSDPFVRWIEVGFAWASAFLESHVPPHVLRDLLVDGVIAGVGSVLVFLPQILFLFFFIALLEGSGYLSRAAFLIDRLMRKVGLHGQAFVPMLSGFACAVPAVMATRTIENKRDRMLTLMVIPLMSCSARLPVYTLIIALLFPANEKVGFVSIGTLMLLGIYVVSTILALIAAGVLGKTLFKGRPNALLLELPSYRMPDMKSVLMVLWERTKAFLSTAGTIILVATIILWALLYFPRPQQPLDTAAAPSLEQTLLEEPMDESPIAAHVAAQHRLKSSFAGRLGGALEPLVEPLGFDWKICIGLIGAFAAREVFVSTMGVVYGLGEEETGEGLGLRQAMKNDVDDDGSPRWTPLVGVSLMVFFMIAMQCISTLAVLRRELKSWKWTLFVLAYLSTTAYVASFVVYQTGRLLGFS